MSDRASRKEKGEKPTIVKHGGICCGWLCIIVGQVGQPPPKPLTRGGSIP